MRSSISGLGTGAFVGGVDDGSQLAPESTVGTKSSACRFGKDWVRWFVRWLVVHCLSSFMVSQFDFFMSKKRKQHHHHHH